ncbi:MAG TPA: VTT domain-containing protein [Vicinamibacterales bacterium]|nr:VTT domain-containing protein [Vicinamibacterales bacterium]
MTRFVTWVQSIALSIGGPGLFIIAFLDSSFLSFPEAVDIIIATAAIHDPSIMLYYATMATAGSLAGCLTLYSVGRRGGEAMLRSKFGARRLGRATALFQRYGVWAVIIPALLPPPAPFKLFVLLAGVSGLRPVPFGIAVLIGRSIRYFGIGILAVWYGRQALDFLHRHGRPVAIAFMVLVVAALVWVLTRRRPEPDFDR